MCVKLQMQEGKIKIDDYDFFLRGSSGNVDQSKKAEPKPNFDWIKQTTWDMLCEAEQTLKGDFTGITMGVNLSAKEWKHWYQSFQPMPEEQHMPGEWGNSKCEDPIQKMIILRAFRPDRVNFAIKNYVKAKMGKDDYITSKPTSITEVIELSRPDLPVIFVLS